MPTAILPSGLGISFAPIGWVGSGSRLLTFGGEQKEKKPIAATTVLSDNASPG